MKKQFAPRHWHHTLEVASDDNFNGEQYVAANPDLRVVKQQDPGFDVRSHFDQYGKGEGRKQLAFRDLDLMAKKFRRFQPILNMEGYHFTAQVEAFPIASERHHHELADYDGESSNLGMSEWIDTLRTDPEGHYLDLGCGFRDVIFDNCLYLEVYPSLTADIITTPGAALPLKDAVLDGLACLAVLEHVDDPFRLIGEISRVVRPNGRIFIDWPFLQPVHGYPSHYYNATRMGLTRAFQDAFAIESVVTKNSQGADFTLSWILNWFIQGLAEGATKNELLDMTVRDLARHEPDGDFYRRCLQLMSDEMQTKLACGNTLIGRRLDTEKRVPPATPDRLTGENAVRVRRSPRSGKGSR